MQYPKYSIVIPAYNESARIPATLREVIACVRANSWPAEIIVVNDGSTDSTAQVVRDIALEAPNSGSLRIPATAAKDIASAQAFSGSRGRGYVHRRRSLGADPGG